MDSGSELLDEIRTRLESHAAHCEFNKRECDCVDIRLLRAALEEITRLGQEGDEQHQDFMAVFKEMAALRQRAEAAESRLAAVEQENARLKDALKEIAFTNADGEYANYGHRRRCVGCNCAGPHHAVNCIIGKALNG